MFDLTDCDDEAGVCLVAWYTGVAPRGQTGEAGAAERAVGVPSCCRDREARKSVMMVAVLG